MLPLSSLLLRHHHHRLPILLRRLHPFSTSNTLSPPWRPVNLPLTHPTYLICSANTSLGKTLVSAGIAASFLLSGEPHLKKFLYLKPVQTGFPSDSDSRFVWSKLLAIAGRRRIDRSLLASDEVLLASRAAVGGELAGEKDCQAGMVGLNRYRECRVAGQEEGEPLELVCKTIFAWRDAVSPHLAAEREDGAVEDSSVLGMLQRCLESGFDGGVDEKKKNVFCVVETAGGVASPGPSGTLQCDLYRPFRLPAILVGDGRLGGISGTISAYETLKLRGYDVVAVVIEDHGLVNEVPLASYLRQRHQREAYL